MTLSEFLSKLDDVEELGGGKWSAWCPNHNGPGLTVSQYTGEIGLQCSHGCKRLKIVQAMGLGLGDLFQDEAPKETPRAKQAPAKVVKPLTITPATTLQTANLPSVKFLVEGILPDGTSLLTAASKIGKSWMVLNLGLCQAAGEPFMGHKTNRCGVLYLALEDSLNRLQNRMNKILNGKPAPEEFFFATEAPKLIDGE